MPASHRWQNGWLCSGKSRSVIWHFMKHDADETCVEKVLSCVWRCQCDQQQMLTDVHLSLTLSDPLWNPSLVHLQKSTHCDPGDLPSRFSLFWRLWRSFLPQSPFSIPQGSSLIAGTCWSFAGTEGTLAVSLSHPVKITHVTVDHLPRYNSPTGDIKSAPKDLEVYVSQKPCCKAPSPTPDELQLWSACTGNEDPGGRRGLSGTVQVRQAGRADADLQPAGEFLTC